MERRNVLLAGLASLVPGCAAAPPDAFDTATQEWPALGDMIPTAQGRIHAWDQGRGQPVIMIHGASGNLRDFTFDLAPRIAGSRRAIAMDRPGLGYSERLDGSGDPAAQAHHLMAAAREMGAQRPILIGHSLGAAVAMAWALADPDGVAGVITVSGTVMPFSERPSLPELLGLDGLLIGAYFNYMQASAASDGIGRFVQRIFRPQDPPEGYVAHIGGPLALRPKALQANKQDVAALNTALRRQAPDYGRLTMPVEVISGTRDFIINPDRQPIPFAKRVPNANLTLLEGVGHMPHHVRPEEILAALDRLDPTGA